MSTMVPRKLTELAVRLSKWSGLQQIGAKDVLVWVRRPGAEYGRFGVALHGDALKMQRRVFGDGAALNNYQSYLDLELQRLLGMPAEVQTGPSGTWPRVQSMSKGSAHISELLEAIESLGSEFLGGESLIEATLMPLEGTPWSPVNDPTPYFSAAKGEVLVQKRPDWIIEVEVRDDEGPDKIKVLGADMCALAPQITHCDSEAIVGGFWKGATPPFLVTRCMDPFAPFGGPPPREIAQHIRDCGGMIHPSLAVGQVPATNFGDLVFVADVSIILPSLRPYKKRGRWPVVVYNTDVWTETTTTFVGEGAAELLTELTDVDNFMYKQHFWALGSRISDRADPLDSVKRLRSSVIKRARIWPRDLDAAQLQELPIRYSKKPEAYAYLEAKVSGVAGMDCFPVAVCPRGQTAKYRSFLKAVGWHGKLLTAPMPTIDDDNKRRWDYAWAVRDAVDKYASADPSQRVVRLEE